MFRWRSKDRAKSQTPAPDICEIIERNVGLAHNLEGEDRRLHMDATQALLETKHWEAAVGLDLTPEMSATIAANAAILVLHLDERMLRTVRSIIVHPTTRTSTGLRSGPVHGVVSSDAVAIIGNAAPGSAPLTLAWDAVLDQSRRPDAGRNVVLHEFAHKIDMGDGDADGAPPLQGARLATWQEILDDEYGHAMARPSDAVLRPYAWTNRAEFFAVATESFFCLPRALRAGKPVLYAGLQSFYQQDPAQRTRRNLGDV